jgi:hypothetical protein
MLQLLNPDRRRFGHGMAVPSLVRPPASRHRCENPTVRPVADTRPRRGAAPGARGRRRTSADRIAEGDICKGQRVIGNIGPARQLPIEHSLRAIVGNVAIAEISTMGDNAVWNRSMRSKCTAPNSRRAIWRSWPLNQDVPSPVIGLPLHWKRCWRAITTRLDRHGLNVPAAEIDEGYYAHRNQFS